MAIGFVREATCFACGDGDLNGFELHEIQEEQWEVFCLPCAKTLDLDGGK